MAEISVGGEGGRGQQPFELSFPTSTLYHYRGPQKEGVQVDGNLVGAADDNAQKDLLNQLSHVAGP